MDPGFSGILLVFGFLLSLAKFLETKKRYLILLLGILLTSIALTYSRASYISLFVGTGFLLFVRQKIKKIFILMAIFLAIVFLIPSWGSEGVRLLRTRSIFTRLESYQEAVALTKESPLFGVGYNNLCIAKEKFLGQPADYSSHSCSGVESGILLTLATTGVLGFLVFLTMLIKVVKATGKNTLGYAFTSSLLAVATHSLFVNSLFYPWVMGYLAILLSISLKERNLR
jgi:O-antigen ligase